MRCPTYICRSSVIVLTIAVLVLGSAWPALANPEVTRFTGEVLFLDAAPRPTEAKAPGSTRGVTVVSNELAAAVLLVESVGDSGDTPTPTDNDFTRIVDGLATAAVLGAGTTVRLEGTFDWTEANANASWVAAGYGILAPTGVAEITLTAENLGDAIIQGPGDDPAAGLDGFFYAFGGTYQDWTVSNLVIRDFSLSLGFFFTGSGGSTEDFNGLTVTNNLIEMPPDVLDIGGNLQNIGIHLGFGENQEISANEIVTGGDGDSTAGTLASIGLQSNTSGGNAYDGLMIIDNIMRVLNAPNASPEFVVGFWENSASSTADITVSGNSFVNEDPANDPANNTQQAFRMHSQATMPSGKTVTYANNLVIGANLGLTWLSFSSDINYADDSAPVEVIGNTVLDTDIAIRVRSDDGDARGMLRYNRVFEARIGLQVDDGEGDAENNWWGCNGGLDTAPCPDSDLVAGTLDADPWLTLTAIAVPPSVEISTPAEIRASVRVNSDSTDLGPIAFPETEVTFATDFGAVTSPELTVDGLATSTFMSATSGLAHVAANLDDAAGMTEVLVTDGGVVTVQSVGAAGATPTPTDNDFTRINDVLQAVVDGVDVRLEGTFDWTEANAAASWALGSDGVDATGDDYAIVPPPGFANVTVFGDPPVTDSTLEGSGFNAIIQGPGDLADQGFEGVFALFGGTYQGWTFQNIDFRDFDWPIGMFCCAGPGGITQFQDVSILDNRFEMPTDLAPAVPGGPEAFQNVAIHYAFGNNQTISGNEIIIPGDGLSDTAESLFAATIAMQCNTSGGTAYDGLLIDGNSVRVLNAQSADPETVIGIWENAHAHNSDITVSNNSFINEAAGNDPALNKQKGFRMTSHSSASTTVLYTGNTVRGANIGMTWLEFSGGVTYPPTAEPIEVISNNIEDTDIAIRVRSDDGSAKGNLHFNRLASSRLGVQALNAIVSGENNWWGCNAGPDQPGCSGTEVISEEDPGMPGTFFPSSLDADPWLVLAVQITNDMPNSGEMTPVTASLIFNSDDADTSGLGTVPDGIEASFASGGGTFSPMTATTVNGIATSTLTAGVIGGAFFADGTIDNETQSDAYTIVTAPEADLEVSFTPVITILDDGETDSIAIAFFNNGPSDVTEADLTVDFPAELASVTWTCGGTGSCGTASGSGDVAIMANLRVGEGVTITADVEAPTPFRGIFDIPATITHAFSDPVPANNTATGQVRSRVIFDDGFESGDTTAWDVTVAN